MAAIALRMSALIASANTALLLDYAARLRVTNRVHNYLKALL
jgi:hypothetical protein